MPWHCGSATLQTGGRTLVMGILNATPDSFSGDGALGKATVARARQMVADGADLLDVGGESTRPGAEIVTADAEIRRVVPLLRALRDLDVPLSIDTTKAAVADAAIEAGAGIVNDISGATADAAMLPLLARHRCGLILMHRRGTPQSTDFSRATPDAVDLQSELLAYFTARIAACENAGIARDRLCLDAGFGFGKSVHENLEIVRRGRELLPFGLPILSALSRKSTIGKILDDAPVEQRLMGTAALSALAIASGADLLRVHDVKEMRDVAVVVDAALGRS